MGERWQHVVVTQIMSTLSLPQTSLLGLVIGLSLAATPLQADPPYVPPSFKIYDIGKLLPGPASRLDSVAKDINNLGQIAGTATHLVDDGGTLSPGGTYGFEFKSYLFGSGTMQRLPDLGGGSSEAVAVNAAGQIAGTCETKDDRLGAHAVVYSNGRVTDLGALPSDASDSSAFGINADGVVVGDSAVNNSIQEHGFVTTPTGLADLGSFGPVDINDFGTIAGLNSAGEAVVYSGGTFTPLGSLGGTSISVTRMNNRGDVVGSGYTAGNLLRAFLYQPSVGMTNLGTLGGESGATDVNNVGQVVGTFVAGDSHDHAFFYDVETAQMFDLNTLVPAGYLGDFQRLEVAYAINDSGWIVGTGTTTDGRQRAFLARPFASAFPKLRSRRVVAQGDPAPSDTTGRTFGLPGNPAIDGAGRVILRAGLKGTGIAKVNNAGLWSFTANSSPVLLAQLGSGAPASGASFTKLSDPVVSAAGTLAYVGELRADSGDATAANSAAVWVTHNGQTAIAARKGDSPDGVSDVKVKAFSQLAVSDAGGIATLVSLSGSVTPRTDLAVCATDASGSLRIIAREGDPVPFGGAPQPVTALSAFAPVHGVTGQTRTFDSVRGNVAVLLKVGAAGQAICLAKPKMNADFDLTYPINTADQMLAGFSLKSFGEPSVNQNGTLAFSAGLRAGGRVIGRVKSGGADLVARTATHAPDRTGAEGSSNFAALGEPVLNNADRVAFTATLQRGAGVTAANASGVWSDVGGALKLVIRAGDVALGTAGRFATFDQLVLPDVGGAIVLATVSGLPAARDQGIWAITPEGTVALVAQKGDLLAVGSETKTVQSLSVFKAGLQAGGQTRSFDSNSGSLTYLATFIDGSWAVYEATIE